MMRRTCSWCHEVNRVGMGAPLCPLCHNCGHRADVSRMDCNCPRCRPLGPGTVYRATVGREVVASSDNLDALVSEVEELRGPDVDEDVAVWRGAGQLVGVLLADGRTVWFACVVIPA